MTPIKTAIVGLSSGAAVSWASNAHLPYLLSPRGRARYQIVALCNSSVEAAKRAIEVFKLPPETRAYGDPQSLADDPCVDLVVCCTRVDVHHPTILPSVKAGKDVFVEWPLAQDMHHVQELARSAEASGSRTIVGLQGRASPPVVKLRQLLEDGSLGKVLSSEVRAAGGSIDRQFLSSKIRFFTQLEVGSNAFTIGFGHLFDQMQHVLGEFHTLRSSMQIQRPDVKLRNANSQEIIETITTEVPDLVVVTARLEESKTAQDASVLFRFRRGQPFQGEPALVWTINCERGEIRLISHSDILLHAGGYVSPVVIEIDDFESEQPRKVEWQWEGWQGELPIPARSVSKLYEEFSDGVAGSCPSFEEALVRHGQLQAMLDDWLQSD